VGETLKGRSELREKSDIKICLKEIRWDGLNVTRVAQERGTSVGQL
jgi:hypothetical protein